jgi:hypothetical protein
LCGSRNLGYRFRHRLDPAPLPIEQRGQDGVVTPGIELGVAQVGEFGGGGRCGHFGSVCDLPDQCVKK